MSRGAPTAISHLWPGKPCAGLRAAVVLAGAGGCCEPTGVLGSKNILAEESAGGTGLGEAIDSSVVSYLGGSPPQALSEMAAMRQAGLP